MKPHEKEETDIRNKIRHALTEARVVLPGAQALLGFQFATILLEGFDKLPTALKWLHFASLACMAIAIVLLITPAAWHRLVEQGEETERFHKLASALIVAALVPIALGLSGDFFVVVYKITRSPPIAAGLSGAALCLFFGLWFGLFLVGRCGRLTARSEECSWPDVNHPTLSQLQNLRTAVWSLESPTCWGRRAVSTRGWPSWTAAAALRTTSRTSATTVSL